MELLNYKVFMPENHKAAESTPLFILHGLFGAMDNWRSQAKRLSKNLPVYTLDLRNHGNSPHIHGMSYREMYEDVLKLAKHLGIDVFHLLGHSMGGKVAMQLGLAHPDIIKSLIIVDIAPKPYPLWHQNTLQALMSTPIETLQSRQQVDEHLKPIIQDISERTFLLKNLRRDPDTKGFSWKCNLQEISKGYLKIAGFSTALQRYSKACLFIKGNESNYIQESDTILIKSLFPIAEIVTFNDSGHLPHIQQADAFYQQIKHFLNT